MCFGTEHLGFDPTQTFADEMEEDEVSMATTDVNEGGMDAKKRLKDFERNAQVDSGFQLGLNHATFKTMFIKTKAPSALV